MRSQSSVFRIVSLFEIFLFLIIIAFSSIKYEVSDDFMMEMILSGTYTRVPDAHLMFSNILWGYFLVPFYKIFPRISWYFVFQLVLCLCSYIAVAYVVSYKTNAKWAYLCIIVFTAFTAMDIYILPQFTKTAMVAASAGSFLFLDSWIHKKGIAPVICGLFLFLFGILIRRGTFYIFVPFLVVYYLYYLWSVRDSRDFGPAVTKAIISTLIFVVLINTTSIVDKFAYSENPYLFFKQYSSIRSGIVDYPRPEYMIYKSKLDAIGVSENDYSMILNWCFADKKVFSLERMKGVLNVLNEYRNNNSFNLINALKTIKRRGMLFYPSTLGCCIIGLLCIVNNKKNILFVLANAVIVISFCILFPLMGRSVYRVEFCIFYGSMLAMLCNMKDGRLAGLSSKIVAMVLLFVTIIMQGPLYIPDKDIPPLNTAEYRSYLGKKLSHSAEYIPGKYKARVVPQNIRKDFLIEVYSHPEVLYVMDFWTTIQTFYYDFSPFISSAVAFPKNVVYLSGVTVNHPEIDMYAHELGYDDWLEALLDDNVVLVDNETQDLILSFYHEHGHPNVKMNKQKTLSGYDIWKLSE